MWVEVNIVYRTIRSHCKGGVVDGGGHIRDAHRDAKLGVARVRGGGSGVTVGDVVRCMRRSEQ